MAAKKLTQEDQMVAELEQDLEKTMDKIKATAIATKDLTGTISGNWPGNPAQRTGSYYITLHKMNMKAGEVALLGSFPEGFVYERADVHGLEAPNEAVQIKLTLEDCGELGIFHINKGKTFAAQISESDVYSGVHAEKKKVYLQTENATPTQGRILITFVGYQIEPWR